MNLDEKTLEKRYLYKGRIINLRNDRIELPNGREAEREVIEHPGGVCILPIDQNGELLLVNQYRYPYHAVLLEAPAGKLTLGEDPLECGKRELKEETGATARAYHSLGVCYPSCGYTEEVIHLYLATGLDFGESCLDEDEFLNVVRKPLEEAVALVLKGELPDAKTQIALLKANELIRAGKTSYR